MPGVLFVDLLADIYDLHGVYSLAAVLKQQGMDVRFIRNRNIRWLLKEIVGSKPDFLLYSSLSTDISKYIAFDRLVKQTSAVCSLIGGPGVTFDPSSINDSTIDAACVGEGELALPDFIRDGTRGKNIFLRGEAVPSQLYPLVDPDKLPFPDRSVVYKADPLARDMPSKQFISGRGCPYQCTYCFNHEFNRMFKGCGDVVRKKSVDYLFDEIRGVRREYPLAHIAFNDDTFIVDKAWFLDFAQRFPSEIGLSYTCNVRANLMDDRVGAALRESGCVGVNWSIESGDDTLRNEVLKRGMSRDQILEAARVLTKNRIPYRIGNMIGLPGERMDQMMATLELNIKAAPALATAAIFTPFPGLAITRYAMDKGHYDPACAGGLPGNMFTRSVMKVSLEENRMVQKLACLFPLFVNFPRMYSSWMKGFLFRMPLCVLRVAWHLFYTVKMMRLYQVRSSFVHRCRLAGRYVRMLLG